MIVIDKYVQRLVAIGDHHVIVEKGRIAWRGSSASSPPIARSGIAISARSGGAAA